MPSLSMAASAETSQSKWYRRFARMISMLAEAKFIPGQIRRPAPNGKNWKSVPMKSTFAALPSSTNLSGKNSSAASQDSEFLPIAHALTMTRVPERTV
ncbi:Os01g0543800 [Oryza sativa Japonica Group]|uniref:Os01g0543800 protein n=1 Tax=Oryza sativa subsp. japonica TaxID=39947 RepID=A0A0P0V3S9_ORYSJ|nr:hypothetical protein EE612_003302 [Oryza sativa]BAS72582.1 Os01g0543800 [Oryza sativa Japonica Group]